MLTLSAASTALSMGAAPREAMSAVQPEPQRAEQLLGIDRLGEIDRGAGFQAFLAVALQRLGGTRMDRKAPDLPLDAAPRAALAASPLRLLGYTPSTQPPTLLLP